MKIELPSGRYVVAVSGGVDSMVLLDLLAARTNLDLIVAHFDHGIRDDSVEDAALVAKTAHKYGLTCEVGSAKLGKRASEDEARKARYAFLQSIRDKYRAAAIITAHHQDDALETMAFNVLRGTKRKGVSALQSRTDIVRPLLGYSKDEIRAYAAAHSIKWREDSTNDDVGYTRNWLRHNVLAKLSPNDKSRLLKLYGDMAESNPRIDQAIQEQLDRLGRDNGLDRQAFTMLPYAVATEVMMSWVSQAGVSDVDQRLIDRLVVSAKTLPVGKQVSVAKNLNLVIDRHTLRLQRKGR